MLRIPDVARARQLITLLSLFAPTLSVALPGDHGVATAFPPDTAGGDHQIDSGHAVLYTLGVVFNSPRMQEETTARGSPALGCFDDHAGRQVGNFRCVLGR